MEVKQHSHVVIHMYIIILATRQMPGTCSLPMLHYAGVQPLSMALKGPFCSSYMDKLSKSEHKEKPTSREILIQMVWWSCHCFVEKYHQQNCASGTLKVSDFKDVSLKFSWAQRDQKQCLLHVATHVQAAFWSLTQADLRTASKDQQHHRGHSWVPRNEGPDQHNGKVCP